MSDEGGSINIYKANAGDLRYQPDEIHFADGTVWKWSETASRKVVRGTSENDVLSANSFAGDTVTIYGLEGDDNITGGRGDDIFVGGLGNDSITSNNGGNDTFVFNRGDGNDSITYYYSAHEPGDGIGKLRFGLDIRPEDVEVRNSGMDVIFAMSDGSGSMTFAKANSANIRYQLDEIHFADGTIWKWSTMPRK